MLTLAAVLMLGQICEGPGCGGGLGSGLAGLFSRRVNIVPPMQTWAPYTSPTYAYQSQVVRPAAYSYAAPTYAYPTTYSYAVPASPPQARVVYSTPAPAKHRAYDIDGKPWTHADPAYLRAWIAGRDAVLQSSRAEVRVIARTSATSEAQSCPADCGCTAPGECGREGCDCTTPPVR